jgi:hypothetical protein
MEVNGKPQAPAALSTWKSTLNTRLNESLEGFKPRKVHPVAYPLYKLSYTVSYRTDKNDVNSSQLF